MTLQLTYAITRWPAAHDAKEIGGRYKAVDDNKKDKKINEKGAVAELVICWFLLLPMSLKIRTMTTMTLLIRRATTTTMPVMMMKKKQDDDNDDDGDDDADDDDADAGGGSGGGGGGGGGSDGEHPRTSNNAWPMMLCLQAD